MNIKFSSGTPLATQRNLTSANTQDSKIETPNQTSPEKIETVELSNLASTEAAQPKSFVSKAAPYVLSALSTGAFAALGAAGGMAGSAAAGLGSALLAGGSIVLGANKVLEHAPKALDSDGASAAFLFGGIALTGAAAFAGMNLGQAGGVVPAVIGGALGAVFSLGFHQSSSS